MGSNTAIPWADDTFNPWWGCVEAGPECDNCYARSFARRLGLGLWGKDAPRRFFKEKHWGEPRKWDREAAAAGVRRRVFCASMADVMEDRRDLDEHRARLWDLIEHTEWLDWLLLTKRPAGFRDLVPPRWHSGSWPRNAWAGTTCGTQAGMARVRTLLECARPAPVRWVSAEPMLERLDFWPLLCGPESERVNWVISGGESGALRREMDVGWILSLKEQCEATGAALFVKQDSSLRPGQQGRIPDRLFIRSFPGVR